MGCLATGVDASSLAGRRPLPGRAPALVGRGRVGNGAGGGAATIHRRVRFRRLAPGEVLPHGAPGQLREPGVILIQRHGTLHSVVECFGTVGVVENAGDAVVDRVGEPTDPSGDWQRTV